MDHQPWAASAGDRGAMAPAAAVEWARKLQGAGPAGDPADGAVDALSATDPWSLPLGSEPVPATSEWSGAEGSRGVTNPHELISVSDAIRQRVEDTLLEWDAFSGMQPEADELNSDADAPDSSLEVSDARSVLASQRTRIKSLLARHESSAASRQHHLESLVEGRARRTAERSKHAQSRSDGRQDVTRRTDADGWGGVGEPELEDFGTSYDAFLDDLLTFDEVETAMKAAQDGDDSLLEAVGGASAAQIVRAPLAAGRAQWALRHKGPGLNPRAASTRTRVAQRTARPSPSSPPASSCRW